MNTTTNTLSDRLIAAIEGECEGLFIGREQASSILTYLQYGAAMDDVQVLRRDAERYRKLRSVDINAIRKGGVFAGLTPDNVVINGEDLDIAVDMLIDDTTPQADAAPSISEAECTCAAKDMPFGRCCKAPPILAAEHRGMRVDYSGLFKQATSALKQGGKEPGLAEMMRQLKDHLTELGQRWYAGDTAVVDELLQLYCVERDARIAFAAPAAAANGEQAC
jgi:hypothetical protein